jgi:hypothetical protein
MIILSPSNFIWKVMIFYETKLFKFSNMAAYVIHLSRYLYSQTIVIDHSYYKVLLYDVQELDVL